jgi:hypothetical protein
MSVKVQNAGVVVRFSIGQSEIVSLTIAVAASIIAAGVGFLLL